MCGGTSTTTQQVSIPPDVLQRYNSVNQQAQQVASTPFQIYSNDPSAFVAPVNSTEQSGIDQTTASAGLAQPYFGAATGQILGAQASAQPYFDAAGQQYLGAQGVGQALNGLAAGQFLGAEGAASPYIGAAANDIGAGLGIGNQLGLASLGSMNSAGQVAQPLENSAAHNISSGLAAAQPYNGGALSAFTQGLGAAQPLNAAANQNINQALSGAQPYQGLATGYATAGAQAVNPTTLDSSSINQYLSPYLQNVLGSTNQLLTQQNQIEQQGALGDAIKSGAFGGDRAGIALANLGQQQELASGNVLSGIANQGYNTALSTAQQQQGLGLSAGQANRAALAGAAPELAAIGNQGFSQGIGAGEAQAGLGQQEFGQFSGLGSNLQGLGNQIYGQNTGTGQAQAALGNQMFTQGMTQAQFEAALGNQLFGQNLSAGQAQAGLGNQAFGMGSTTGQNLQGLGGQAFSQGAATGQNLQGLGQINYTTGANTAQQLAGLGAGAQSAALSGAQAELGAGQLQQQTTQAGNTALYNQFLQAQSYPFQVAQFLANIAEGTGALSGSTTTTTQPGGLFSDRRLKHDVKLVGLTFDKQPVYSFKYKGDDTTHMGLMAQDVEKTHPGAVGLAQGFKTVDYGKATKDASKRGRFADGGAASDGLAGGFDPGYMAQLLSSQRGLYGPYMAGTGGPYGGGVGRVPAATLPVGQLKVAGPLPQQTSALAQMRQAADFGDDVSKAASGAEKGMDWLKSKFADDAPNYDSYAKGGRARRADGGDTPYEDQQGPLSLDIPDAKPSLNQLQTPGKPPSPHDDLGDLADIAKIAAAVAGMNRGGRAKFADGGDPDDGDPDNGNDDFASPSPGGGVAAGSRGFQMDYKPTDDTALPNIRVGQVTPSQIGHAAFNAALPFVNEAGVAIRGLAGGLHPRDAGATASWDSPKPAPWRRLAVSDNGPPPSVGRPVGDIKEPPPGLAAGAQDLTGLPAPLTAQGEGLAAAPQLSSDGLQTGADMPAPADDKPSAASDVLHGLQNSPIGGYFSGLKHGDLPTWISLLSAIGAAGTAPTQHLGTALAAGLTAGAHGYMGAKETQADIARTQALTGVEQAQAANVAAEANQRVQSKAPQGYVAVPGAGPHGEQFTGPDGKPWHYELQVTATNFGPTAGAPAPHESHGAPSSTLAPSSDTDGYMASTYHIDPSQPAVANHERAIAMNPELAPLDDAARTAFQARIGNLQDADNTHRQLVQLSQAVNDLSHSTLTGQGHGSEYRTRLANIYTTTANLFGIPVDPTVTKDLADNQIIAKIKELSAAAMAHQYGEKAASIAHSISGVLPGGDLQGAAANELLAQMIVQTQQPRDLSQYGNTYAGRYGLMVNVEPSFQRDMGPVYDKDQRAMRAFMASPAFSPALADLQSANPKIRDRAIQTLDGRYGAGFHRYFTGGQ